MFTTLTCIKIEHCRVRSHIFKLLQQRLIKAPCNHDNKHKSLTGNWTVQTKQELQSKYSKHQTSVLPVVPRNSTPSTSKSSTPLPHCCGTREQQWLSARTGNQFTVYNDYLLVWKGHWITVHNDYLPAWKGLLTCLEGTTYLPGKDYLPRGKGQRIIVNSVYLPRRKRQWIIVHYILAWIG